MNNLSSYCGLVDAKIRAFDKDLPVLLTFFKTWKKCLPEDGDAEMRSLNSSFSNRSSQGVVIHGDIETPFIHFLFCFHF